MWVYYVTKGWCELSSLMVFVWTWKVENCFVFKLNITRKRLLSFPNIMCLPFSQQKVWCQTVQIKMFSGTNCWTVVHVENIYWFNILRNYDPFTFTCQESFLVLVALYCKNFLMASHLNFWTVLTTIFGMTLTNWTQWLIHRKTPLGLSRARDLNKKHKKIESNGDKQYGPNSILHF